MYYIYVLVQAATQGWNPLLRVPKIDVTMPYCDSDTVGVFQSASLRDQVISSPVHILTPAGQRRFITTRKAIFTEPFEGVARLAQPHLCCPQVAPIRDSKSVFEHRLSATAPLPPRHIGRGIRHLLQTSIAVSSSGCRCLENRAMPAYLCR